jgi:hypothetical protein
MLAKGPWGLNWLRAKRRKGEGIAMGTAATNGLAGAQGHDSSRIAELLGVTKHESTNSPTSEASPRRPSTRTRSCAEARDSSSIMPWRAHSHSSRKIRRSAVSCPSGQDLKEIPTRRWSERVSEASRCSQNTGARAYQRPGELPDQPRPQVSPAHRVQRVFDPGCYAAVRLIAASSSASSISTESTIAVKRSSSYLSEAQKKFN